jgi:hypothetical protein
VEVAIYLRKRLVCKSSSAHQENRRSEAVCEDAPAASANGAVAQIVRCEVGIEAGFLDGRSEHSLADVVRSDGSTSGHRENRRARVLGDRRSRPGERQGAADGLRLEVTKGSRVAPGAPNRELGVS